MAFWKSLSGQYRISLTSSDLSQTLTAINLAGIALTEIRFRNELQLEAIVQRNQYAKLDKLLKHRGEELENLSLLGIFWKLKSLRKRPVLVIGILALLFLSFFLPSRVLFVNVDGNTMIPDNYIIENAKQCGIGFFSSRREVRSEKIKNRLLSAIPQLQWVGVTTMGCVAQISVRERKEVTSNPVRNLPCSIVADRDGIIQEMTVLSGTPLCKVGQGVKSGQVLVSGYTDCGLSIRLERAEAEVFATTFRQLQAISPGKMQVRQSVQQENKKYFLRIGKNIINLWKDSGISHTECVRMYEEEYLSLPGGFSLPVALITETCICYKTRWVDLDAPGVQMEEAAKSYLSLDMVSGEILQCKTEVLPSEDSFMLSGRFVCREMIGKVRYEENLTHNGT